MERGPEVRAPTRKIKPGRRRSPPARQARRERSVYFEDEDEADDELAAVLAALMSRYIDGAVLNPVNSEKTSSAWAFEWDEAARPIR